MCNQCKDEHRRFLGRKFGYPECCIQDFINRNAPTQEKRKLWGTGYVPCEKCNNFTEDQLVNIINLNRKCPVKFTAR